MELYKVPWRLLCFDRGSLIHIEVSIFQTTNPEEQAKVLNSAFLRNYRRTMHSIKWNQSCWRNGSKLTFNADADF